MRSENSMIAVVAVSRDDVGTGVVLSTHESLDKARAQTPRDRDGCASPDVRYWRVSGEVAAGAVVRLAVPGPVRKARDAETLGRLRALARALGVESLKDGPRLDRGLGRWWLTHCHGGDVALPRTAGVFLDGDALDAAEAWVAENLDVVSGSAG